MARSTSLTLETEIGQFIKQHRLKADPLAYVMYMFPWKTDLEIQKVPLPEAYRDRFPGYEWGPDLWACEFLDQLGAEIRKRKFNGRDPVDTVRFSTASGHGIGKSTMTGWLTMYIMDCWPMSKGVVTANTGEQLRSKTWASIAMWHSKALSKDLWEITTGRGAMSLYRKHGDKHIQSNWKVDGQVCRIENAEAFQGLHAASGVPFFIFDEASGIDDAIFTAREGAQTDGMPLWFDWGNPTRMSGRFHANTVGELSHRYITRHIDSRDCHITKKELFNEWVQDYGEDSDFVKVRVRGIFPSTGSVQFIGSWIAEEASKRELIKVPGKQAVIGVDVARFGDNSTVIYPRIGDDARSFGYKEYKGLDGWQVAEKVKLMVKELQDVGIHTAAIFVDGGGLGSSPVDNLRHTGYAPIDCNFAHSSGDIKYHRRGDAMWGRMKDALSNRLAIPRSKELITQLTQREYGMLEATGRIKLESKKDLVERLGKEASPDIADALALTYYSDVEADVIDPRFKPTPKFAQSEYDPLSTSW